MTDDQENWLRVYLAGPEVFLENALEIGERKKALCKRYRIKGLFPFDNDALVVPPGGREDREIYRANVEMIAGAACVIANLTPFRGPSADVGTVFELGLAKGLGKIVYGYTNVADDLVTRMRAAGEVGGVRADGKTSDRRGMTVEDYGNADNLMIDGCLEADGNPFVRHAASVASLYDDLTAFEICLERVSERFGTRSSEVVTR